MILINVRMLIIICINNLMKQKSIPSISMKSCLDKALIQASNEKLLPKIVWDFGKSLKQKRIFQKYRNSVLTKFKKQLQFPIVYNPQQAKTEKQMFRQKIIKSINHEIPIDYLGCIKNSKKRVMTYNDLPLQQIQYQTKKQYTIFRNFNQQTFNQEYSNIYEDKLQCKINHSVKQKSKRINTVSSTQPVILTKTPINTEVNDEHSKNNSRAKEYKSTKRQIFSQNKTEGQTQYIDSRIHHKLQSPRLESISPGKQSSNNEEISIIASMRKIGKYSKNASTGKISLTKQSVYKFLKNAYEKPNRIIDFMEIGPVETFESYSKIMKNLKLMPKKHIDFMVFMFYDNNNDGYICQNDLLHLSELTQKCPLLQIDLARMRKLGLKYRLSSIPNYLELYKLAEVTQSKYFKWLSQNIPIHEDSIEDLRIKNQILNMKKKKTIYLDFASFESIYQNQRPILWYDLIWRLAGFTFQKLRYQ